MPKKSTQTLVIIDGNAIIHRAYHALPRLTVKDGTVVNAVYGFATTLLKVAQELTPTHMAVTFDLEGPTFRHEAYEGYKATRVKADQDLYDQIPLVKQLVEKFDVAIYEKRGYEADDVIGTIVRQVHKEKAEVAVYIVTGDMDTLQLVDDRHGVKVYALRKGMSDVVVFDEEKVRERFGGLSPQQVVDFKALSGDSSDNIKGVSGIGQKTATALLLEFGTLEKTLDAAASNKEYAVLKGAVRAKLRKGAEDAKMSQSLARIHTEVPLAFELGNACFKIAPSEKLITFLKQLEFFSLISRLQGKTPDARRKKSKTASVPETVVVENLQQWDAAVGALASKRQVFVSVVGASVVGEPPEGFVVGTAQQLFFVRWSALSKKGKQDFFKWLERVPEVVGHDLKKTLCAVLDQNGGIPARLFDVFIAAYLLSPGNRTYDAPTLVLQHSGVQLKTASAQGSLFGDDHVRVAEELWHICALRDHFEKELKESGMLQLFTAMEMPLVPLLAKLEAHGVKIDTKKMASIAVHVDRAIEKLTRQIYNHAGEEFNISSSQQLREVLFERMGISPEGIKKGKTGLSTAASELEKLWEQHPIIPLISEYRELTKLKTTYIDVFPTLVNKHTGRIHGTFNQAVAATGRLSSSDPNLQNIPIRTPLGKEIRDAFIAERGNKLVIADYSQIELRIVAHLAQDKRMAEVFKKGEDIHRETAAAIHGVKLADVDSAMRRSAKEVNFGVLYGMGAHGLSMRTGMTRFEAKNFIDKYFEAFSGVKKYLDETIKRARTQGYVETLYGRRRYIPEINASNFQLRNAGERMAVNLPVQGTAADIMKLAMIEVDREVREAGLEQVARMILQVHDEMVLEVAEKQAARVAELVKEAMQRVAKLDVPVVADVAVVDRWGEK